LDLSLISAYHFNEGGFQSTDFSHTGGNNIGSALNLNSRATRGLQVDAGFNSMQEMSLGVKYAKSIKRTRHSISIQGVNLDGGFNINHYTNNTEKEIITNNDYRRLSFLYELGYGNNAVSGSTTVYGIMAERQIPSSLNTNSDATQNDLNLLIGNHLNLKKIKLKIANQVSREFIHYQSEKINVNSQNLVYNINSTVTKSFKWKKWKYDVGLGNENALYQADDIEQTQQWSRNRLYANAFKQGDGSHLTYNAQVQPYRGKMYTSAKVRYFKSRYMNKDKYLGFLGEISKNYRLPSLNDLYWYQPGQAVGNIDLLPESGYRLNMKINFPYPRYENTLSVNIEPYAAFTNNLIVWRLDNLEWSPVNIKETVSYGSIISVKAGKRMGDNYLGFIHTANWTKAFEVGASSNQLIFTPQFTSSTVLSFTRSKFKAYFNARFIGKNFITTSNSQFIDSYRLFEAGASYRTKHFRVGVVGSNLTNNPYFTIPNRPLPGRQIKINLSYFIKS
jgi:hypothetical protein